MKTYQFASRTFDTIDVKCMVTSKGVQADPEIYTKFSSVYNISPDPRRTSCIILPDGTVMPFSDMAPFLDSIGKRYFWNEDEKKSYHPQLETPFYVKIIDDKPALTFHEEFIDFITFPTKNDFYDQTAADGTPYLQNAVLQGTDWLTFGYLWPCDFAAAGFPCQYCHCGNGTCAQVKNGQKLPAPLSVESVCEMISYALKNAGTHHIQITGGSTFSGEKEARYFKDYLDGINSRIGRENIAGDIIYYVTPPKDFSAVDYYLDNGADKMGVGVEVWDEQLAAAVTPGKIKYTTRARHLELLNHIVEKYGPNRCFSNFVVGIEPFESLSEGARYMAERGIVPTVSVLQTGGLKVLDRVSPMDIDYFIRVKELFLELYSKYGLRPAERSGENGCIEEEFYRAVHEG